jgi:hypothetical protein
MTWQISATIIIAGGWLLYWIMDQIEIRRGIPDGYHDYNCTWDEYEDGYYNDPDTVDLHLIWDWPSVTGWSMDHPFPIRALTVRRSANLHSVHVNNLPVDFPF